jgi:hypothetical protein
MLAAELQIVMEMCKMFDLPMGQVEKRENFVMATLTERDTDLRDRNDHPLLCSKRHLVALSFHFVAWYGVGKGMKRVE